MHERQLEASKPKLHPQVRAFNAAKTPDALTGWTSQPVSIDSDLKLSGKTLRARSREQAQNNDYIKKFLSMNEVNIVGHTGIKLRMNVKDAAGKPDKQARDIISDSWRRWGKYGIPTVDGIMSWHDVEKMIVRTVPMDGGLLIRHVRGFPNAWGYAIQLLDVDFINTDFDNRIMPDGNIVRMGIEKTSFGRPVAFYLYTSNPGDQSFFVNAQGRRFVRVPAEELDYIYLPQRVTQTHGYPWVHSALIGLKHLGAYREAEIISARIGASKNTYYKPALDAALGPDGSAPHDAEDADGTPIEEILEPGQSTVLPAGWDVDQPDPNHPNSNYAPFETAILRGVSSGLDVSFASLANDLTKVNFSSARGGIQEERNVWRLLQRFYASRVHDRVFSNWLPMALMTDMAGQLPLADLNRLDNPLWRPRGWEWIDPLKDMSANEKAIGFGLKSRQEISAERGRDWEEVVEELKEENEAAAAAGVDISITTDGSAPTETVVIETEEGEEINAT